MQRKKSKLFLFLLKAPLRLSQLVPALHEISDCIVPHGETKIVDCPPPVPLLCCKEPGTAPPAALVNTKYNGPIITCTGGDRPQVRVIGFMMRCCAQFVSSRTPADSE